MNRTAKLVAHLDSFAKGYANEKTLAKALQKYETALSERKLLNNLEIVTLSNGRRQPVLVFGPREEVTQEAINFAFHGLPLFQY